MVTIETATAGDLDVARRLHNRFTAQSISEDTFREWFDAVPDLFLLAREEGSAEVVGVATGKQHSPAVAELAGLGVDPDRRREGIGSRLLERFEGRAAASGFERVSVGSAGGYVDEFYASHGYEPEWILVRRPVEDPAPAVGTDDVAEEQVVAGTRKYYVEADGLDQSFLASVREDFGDEEAIYIMRKSLGEA